MKKTYASPTLIESGKILLDTRGETDPGDDDGNALKGMAEGSVGFNL